MSRPTKGDRLAAVSIFTTWRAEGVPMLVTAHEAHRLTGGVVGAEGDHGAAGGLPTAGVALSLATARRLARVNGVAR
jgi:hypothetical protein